MCTTITGVGSGMDCILGVDDQANCLLDKCRVYKFDNLSTNYAGRELEERQKKKEKKESILQ